ncbi:MAG TPA: YihY/virulence factor BrkB family protein [Ornithinimicrobium sp.]|uniref:YihY/virulence factor BrkB family protein n=1 Tax=Ornithinimicrobium sp. TaxID=1977084 RepID=UPI002B498CBA|nr:YihY/virulence factor BrkB family protein [Ornithinimicrobium sp.]HKJ12258.1 YihY/virulence factor BrkB family protein [Ornithinimicrobium sp.]
MIFGRSKDEDSTKQDTENRDAEHQDGGSASTATAEKERENESQHDTSVDDSEVERNATNQDTPHPESEDKPDTPGEVKGQGWAYTARKTLREFTDDQCTDIAAALTYFAVLALFPALIAVLSLLSLVGQAQKTVTTVMDILTQLGGQSVASTLEPTVQSLATAPGGLLALIIGLATALWSASGYVMAFSRGMNRVYDIEEGRPVWKLRPAMLLLTAVMVVMVVVIALLLVVSGPAASTIGSTIGLSSTVVTVFQIAKWPVILILAALTIALLYYATPNVKQPKFKWMSVGAAFAILVWIVASALFGFYVANFSSYSATYGSLAGVIIFLLWLWITNIALLFGAELDAELERSRQLQAGLKAEKEIQLPARDTSKIEKQEEKEAKDIEKGRALRKDAESSR